MEDYSGEDTVFVVDEVSNVIKEAIEATIGSSTFSQNKVNQWTSSIIEQSLNNLSKLGKPFKYIVTCIIMQKNGAGLHTASSCYWDNSTDGCKKDNSDYKLMATVENEVREGFICPICLKDFCTVEYLQEHFDLAHFTQDKGSHNFISLLSKATKKILQNDLEDSSSSSFTGANPNYHKSYAFYDNPDESQPFGLSRDLTTDFRKFRHSQMTRTSVEMNRLIIRLEKLTDSSSPTDPLKRKAYEQQIVPWVEDKLVNNCPNCGAKFGVSLNSTILQGGDLLLRRHHCRLCGYMICSDCSYMLPSSQAKRLLHLVHNQQKVASYGRSCTFDYYEEPADDDVIHKSPNLSDRSGPTMDFTNQLTFIQRADSLGSLNQFLPVTGHSEQRDYELRCCEVCKEMMDLKFKRIEEKSVLPRFMRLYDKMRGEMLEIDKLLPMYEQMIHCIFDGKTTYSLAVVNDRRNELKMKFEKVAMLGKQLEDFGKVDQSPDDPNPHPRLSLLLSSINKYAKRYVLERMAPLRSLPRPEEYEARVAQRNEKLRKEHEAEERALRQKQSAEFSKIKKSTPVHRNPVPARSHTDSWIPENHSSVSLVSIKSSDQPNCSDSTSSMNDSILDTLELQILNVNGYLAQALDANRQNEVSMLQTNLKELKIAYEQRRIELGLKNTYSAN